MYPWKMCRVTHGVVDVRLAPDRYDVRCCMPIVGVQVMLVERRLSERVDALEIEAECR